MVPATEEVVARPAVEPCPGPAATAVAVAVAAAVAAEVHLQLGRLKARVPRDKEHGAWRPEVH